MEPQAPTNFRQPPVDEIDCEMVDLQGDVSQAENISNATDEDAEVVNTIRNLETNTSAFSNQPEEKYRNEELKTNVKTERIYGPSYDRTLRKQELVLFDHLSRHEVDTDTRARMVDWMI